MEIVAYGVGFVAQTIILFVAMWIMVKVQDLNFNIPGLLGSAALATALEMVLDHYVHVNLITIPIVCVVLCFCIAKVTVTTNVFDTDVLFTVAVGYAVNFVLNLFVIGALMGELHPSDLHADGMQQKVDEMAESYDDADESPTASGTNGVITTLGKAPRKLTGTNSSTVATNAIAKAKSGKTAKKTAYSRIPEPEGPGAQAAKGFVLKGITRGSATPDTAMIYTGIKTYNISAGESVFMDTATGKVSVQCDAVEDEKVVLSIGGLMVTLYLP